MNMLTELERIIADRRQHPREGSYTNRLMADGRPRMAQKVGEEAVEVVVAALQQDRDEQIGELADLFYHVLVLMNDLDLKLDDIEQKLAERHK